MEQNRGPWNNIIIKELETFLPSCENMKVQVNLQQIYCIGVTSKTLDLCLCSAFNYLQSKFIESVYSVLALLFLPHSKIPLITICPF